MSSPTLKPGEQAGLPAVRQPERETGPLPRQLVPTAPGKIAQVWANDGGDKVARDELRAAAEPSAVHNSVWDGTTISLFGARNEVVAFNLVLEAPAVDAPGVEVSRAQH
jgi:hypothetical protein